MPPQSKKDEAKAKFDALPEAAQDRIIALIDSAAVDAAESTPPSTQEIVDAYESLPEDHQVRHGRQLIRTAERLAGPE